MLGWGVYAPPLHHPPAKVAAVLALHRDVLCAFEGGLECLKVLAMAYPRRGGSVLCVPHVKKKNMMLYAVANTLRVVWCGAA